ncbi:magnesium-translocating P-type ATPase [Collinsella sp. An2]|uniref:magnesium-translocating P-type ATPase n=1 Tax=Collinsella sp. An2 TaxID=1965585 RepID=UPI0013025603|nr:magnesium-translocating P-type ATPase [Collinsella sp. An2]
MALMTRARRVLARRVDAFKFVSRSTDTAHARTRAVERRQLDELATCSVEEAFARLQSGPQGLSADQVERARARYGDNAVDRASSRSVAQLLAAAFVNPFTAILAVLAAVSFYTDVCLASPGDRSFATVAIVVAMIVVSGALHLVQDVRSGRTMAALEHLTEDACTVVRDGATREVPLDDVVAGDVVCLAAGDLVPADVRIVAARDLFVAQAALTGESEPQEKVADVASAPSEAASGAGGLAYPTLAFMGTSVVSGTGHGVVIRTGARTMFGSMASAVAHAGGPTAFDRGVASVSRVLVALMLAMVPVVVAVNGFARGNWIEALLFAVSVAVGLTPEMLPMIMTTCLAKGAQTMAEHKVVVKRLDAIQDLGAMDVLCSDKTGTLTRDAVALERALDVSGRDNTRVLRHAYLVSRYQTGLRSVLDRAVVEHVAALAQRDDSFMADADRFQKVDELPFDFARRRMSVVVRDTAGKTQLITKGAVEEMLGVCSFAEMDGAVVPLDGAALVRARRTADDLGGAGLRVIAVAQKADPRPAGELTVADECDMVLLGYLAFLDQPKESAAQAVRELARRGVAVKVLTGDNERVAAAVCGRVGIDASAVLTADDIDRLSDAKLAEAANSCQVFARLTPEHKMRVIGALRASDHVVGFMGDGVNDAGALRAADVGVSVDTAADVAREAADVTLLEKDLRVLAAGIDEGRRTYINMMKYIKMTLASNFGNVISVLVASLVLPFLPMSALQIVLLGLIYDLSCAALPWDAVDSELVCEPRRWEAGSLVRYMVTLGPLSSLFDVLTFAFLFFVACPLAAGCPLFAPGAYAALDGAGQALFVAVFQAGWFVESMWSQSLVVHLLRTERVPFIQSRASAPVCVLTAAGIAVATLLPFLPVAGALDMAPLPPAFFAFLAAAVAGYLVLGIIATRVYRRRFGSLL